MNEVLYDDSYQLDDSEIPESGAKALPLPGTYVVKATSVGRAQKFDKTGPDEFTDANGLVWPVLQINRIDIVEPQENRQSAAPFHRIKTRPFQVKGKGQTKVWTAQHVTALRSLDRSAVTGLTLQEAVSEVETRLKGGDSFTANIGYTAYDSEWAKPQIEQLGPMPSKDDAEAYAKYWEERRKISNAATLYTKDFKNPDGSYRTETPSKTGQKQLQARLTLSFVPSDKEVELGPYAA